MSNQSIYDLGYDNFLSRGQQTPTTVAPTPAMQNVMSGTDPASMTSGEQKANVSLVDGFYESSNFVTGVSGWKIDADGNAEFNSVTVRGTIYASAGAIGGFTISATAIKDTAGTFGMDSTVTAGDDIRFWAGHATPASAPFRVTESGSLTASSGVIGGFTITSTSLYGSTIKTAATVGVGNTGVIMDTAGLRGYDAVLGLTFNLPTDGSAPSFSSGVIHKTTFEIDTSGILRTSATVGDGTASSAGVLINNTGIYACEANQLLANANVRILANGSAYFSGTVTATGGTFSGITAASIDVSATGYIRGGQSAYNTGTGFWLGYDTTAYKLSIGNPTGNRLTWDGSNLFVKADNSNLKLYTVIRADGTGDYTTVKAAVDAGETKIYIDLSAGNITETGDISTTNLNIEIAGNSRASADNPYQYWNMGSYNFTLSGGTLIMSGVSYRHLNNAESAFTGSVSYLSVKNCTFSNLDYTYSKFFNLTVSTIIDVYDNQFYSSVSTDAQSMLAFILGNYSTTNINGNIFTYNYLPISVSFNDIGDEYVSVNINDNNFYGTVTPKSISVSLVTSDESSKVNVSRNHIKSSAPINNNDYIFNLVTQYNVTTTFNVCDNDFILTSLARSASTTAYGIKITDVPLHAIVSRNSFFVTISSINATGTKNLYLIYSSANQLTMCENQIYLSSQNDANTNIYGTYSFNIYDETICSNLIRYYSNTTNNLYGIRLNNNANPCRGTVGNNIIFNADYGIDGNNVDYYTVTGNVTRVCTNNVVNFGVNSSVANNTAPAT